MHKKNMYLSIYKVLSLIAYFFNFHARREKLAFQLEIRKSVAKANNCEPVWLSNKNYASSDIATSDMYTQWH